MSLKGIRLRIVGVCRRKAEVLRSQNKEPSLRRVLSCYCIIEEKLGAVVKIVKLQRRVAELQVLAELALQTSSFDGTLRHQPFLRFKGLHSCPTSSFLGLHHVPPTDLRAAIFDNIKYLPQSRSNMSSRVSTGARPGARFAQFKLVLLGS